jgi:hypothetical protein
MQQRDTPTQPEISIEALEQELATEEAFDELAQSDTADLAIPEPIAEDIEIYEIRPNKLARWASTGAVIYVPVASAL